MRLGVCGDDCEECPRYAATASGDRASLAAVADLWFRSGLRERLPSPEELACEGCRPSSRCAHAAQRDCALGRGFGHCGECPAYPCAIAAAGLARSEALAEACRLRCSPEDYERLARAFFRKRENLTAGKGGGRARGPATP